MKKVLGYGYKFNESCRDAFTMYGNLGTLPANKKKCLEDIRNEIKSGGIPKNSKPKVFRIVMEVLDE